MPLRAARSSKTVYKTAVQAQPPLNIGDEEDEEPEDEFLSADEDDSSIDDIY